MTAEARANQHRALTVLTALTVWQRGRTARLTVCRAGHGLMEVSAVGLSTGEQRALSCIADELAASDPKLASMLGVFNRLSSGEEMPAGKRTGGSQQREAGHSHRTRRHARNRRLQPRIVKAAWPLLTWILISAVLITVAIVLSHIGHGSDGRWRCPQVWPTTCTQP